MKTKPVKPKYEIHTFNIFGVYEYEIEFDNFLIVNPSHVMYRSEKTAKAAARRALATLKRMLT